MSKLQKKKIISVLLACVLMLCTTIPVSADTIVSQRPVTSISQLTDDDLAIPKDVAEYIAKFFVEDMIATGQTFWNSGTTIVDCIVTYDETGKNINSYIFKLTRGYVIVAAYVDMPNPILEWSDEEVPVCEELNYTPTDKVVYAGPLTYYLDEGDTTLTTADGGQISRTLATDKKIENLRNLKNIRPKLQSEIIEMKQSATKNSVGRAADNTPGGYIDNPIAYAKSIMNGVWTNNGYANNWESYANFATTSNFSGYTNHCGPTAITNAIKMYGKKYNNSSIKNSTNQAIFDKVIAANNAASNSYYNGIDGTWNSTADEFIKKSFAQCGVSISTYGQYTCSLENIKNASTGNRLMYIMLVSHALYGNHHVIGYAWTCMTNESTNFYFIKICDGHKSSGRYLDQILVRSDKYWEIYFG